MTRRARRDRTRWVKLMKARGRDPHDPTFFWREGRLRRRWVFRTFVLHSRTLTVPNVQYPDAAAGVME